MFKFECDSCLNFIGFNGAETNREIAHILSILLMNSYAIQICSEATFI